MSKKEIDLYLSLCAEMPNMIIHSSGELNIELSPEHTISIYVRGDGDIEVDVDDGCGGGAVDMSDREEMISGQPNTEKISKMIKDKIDFVYELCFTF